MKKRKRNILLVEPYYGATWRPLPLQRLARYHLQKGDKVKFINQQPSKYFSLINKEHYHIIYITSIFTYYSKITISTINQLKRLFPKSKIVVGGIFATLMPDYIEKKTGIKPIVGLYDKIENLSPEFSCFPYNSQAYIFTSRGCIRKCAFCAVKTLEPKFHIRKTWKQDIDVCVKAGIKLLCIEDNNFIATPFKHQKEVINYIASKYPKLVIDFNQALDCRIFKDKHAKLLSKIKLESIRFAFDTMEEDGFIDKAINLANKYKIKATKKVYLLYNFNDSPEDLWYRIKKVLNLKAEAIPLRFAPLNALDRSYIGPKWSKQLLTGFIEYRKKISYTGAAIVSRKERDESIIGKTPEEFIDLILNKGVSQKYFSSFRKPKVRKSTIGLLGEENIKDLEESFDRVKKQGHVDDKGIKTGKKTPGKYKTFKKFHV